MTKKNGIVLRNIGIVVGILLTMSGIIWAFATQSGNLDRVVKDVVKIEEKAEADIEKVGEKNKAQDVRINLVEDAVMLMQYDVEHIKDDMIEQIGLTKEILKEIKK